jgi:hypothetical protein
MSDKRATANKNAKRDDHFAVCFFKRKQVRRQGGNLRIREQGLKTRASGTADSLVGTPECGNMITLKSCPKPLSPANWISGF